MKAWIESFGGKVKAAAPKAAAAPAAAPAAADCSGGGCSGGSCPMGGSSKPQPVPAAKKEEEPDDDEYQTSEDEDDVDDSGEDDPNLPARVEVPDTKDSFPAMPAEGYEPGDDAYGKAGEKKMAANDKKCAGDWAGVVELLTEAVLLAPSPLTYAKRAEALLKVSPPRPNAAIADCNAALAINPDSAKAMKIRGAAWAMLGEWVSSAADLRTACRLDHDPKTDALRKAVEPKVGKIEGRARRESIRDRKRKDRDMKRRIKAAKKAREEAKKRQAEEAKRRAARPAGGMPQGFPGGGMGGVRGDATQRRLDIYTRILTRNDCVVVVVVCADARRLSGRHAGDGRRRGRRGRHGRDAGADGRAYVGPRARQGHAEPEGHGRDEGHAVEPGRGRGAHEGPGGGRVRRQAAGQDGRHGRRRRHARGRHGRHGRHGPSTRCCRAHFVTDRQLGE